MKTFQKKLLILSVLMLLIGFSGAVYIVILSYQSDISILPYRVAGAILGCLFALANDVSKAINIGVKSIEELLERKKLEKDLAHIRNRKLVAAVGFLYVLMLIFISHMYGSVDAGFSRDNALGTVLLTCISSFALCVGAEYFYYYKKLAAKK